MSEIKRKTEVTSQARANPGLHREESLRRMGVRFELIFAEKNGWFQFESLQESRPESIDPWQHEFFDGMRIDLKLLAFSDDFREFPAKNHPFHRDCFATGAGEFLLFVRHAKDQTLLSVFVSERSLQDHKTAILNLPPPTRSRNEPESRTSRDYEAGDDDMKIEIA